MLSSYICPDSLLEANYTPLGRGLVARSPVAAETPLLSVAWPNLLCVTDELDKNGTEFSTRVLEDGQLLHVPLPPPLIDFLSRPDVTWSSRLAAWLLWLRKSNSIDTAGIWSLYTQLLPLESEMTCLMNYRDIEAPELQDPQLISLVASQRSQLASLHSAVFSSSTGLPELKELDLAPTFEDTLWAVCMVNSRCFSETIGKEVVTLMVPAADFANHSPAPNAEYRYNIEQDAFQLVSLKQIPQGQEVCISYGCIHKSNPEMLRDYGFFIQGNLCDRIPFSSRPPPDEEESRNRYQISKSPPQPSLNATRFMAEMGIEGGVKPGPRNSQFELSGDWSSAALLPAEGDQGIANRRKVVTLLSLGAGHLRGIPKGSVAEAMAVLEMSEEEVQWERKAVAELERRCLEQLNSMPTSIQTDEELLIQGVEKLGLRRWAAVGARLESKRKLEAAAQHLRTYLGTLT
ncbi:hypothetical protein Ndes2526B_g03883 [Nannochloris sp. 'desiccata']|nr:hypothetical protein KSW81_005253 [Chlorella desiccata (nom. nud.)]KAH7621547.1 putative Protein PLASTID TRANSCRIPTIONALLY ACTIVE 14 [Chlorella desiccata (nom. nud.)]